MAQGKLSGRARPSKLAEEQDAATQGSDTDNGQFSAAWWHRLLKLCPPWGCCWYDAYDVVNCRVKQKQHRQGVGNMVPPKIAWRCVDVANESRPPKQEAEEHA